MLTGDKVETATCIAISTGLKANNQKLFYIREITDIDHILKSLNEFKELSDTVLIIDGECLEICLKKIQGEFFDASLKVIILILRLQLLYVADVVRHKRLL
jgi:phospholipid-translocating ATPase